MELLANRRQDTTLKARDREFIWRRMKYSDLATTSKIPSFSCEPTSEMENLRLMHEQDTMLNRTQNCTGHSEAYIKQTFQNFLKLFCDKIGKSRETPNRCCKIYLRGSTSITQKHSAERNVLVLDRVCLYKNTSKNGDIKRNSDRYNSSLRIHGKLKRASSSQTEGCVESFHEQYAGFPNFFFYQREDVIRAETKHIKW